MDNQEKMIEIKTEDGKILKGEILFAFNANGEDFVLYEIDETAYAAKYDENNDLTPVMEDEWPLIEKIFNQYMEDCEKAEEGEEELVEEDNA